MVVLDSVGLDQKEGTIDHLCVIDGLDIVQGGYLDGDITVEHRAHLDLMFEDVRPYLADFVGFKFLGSVLLQHVLIKLITVRIDSGDHELMAVRAKVIFFVADIEYGIPELEQILKIDLQFIVV
jgi:hypothetical protein